MLKIEPPLRDVRDRPAVCYCKRCGHEIYQDDPIVTEDGQRMHFDCFEEYINDLLKNSPDIVAECLGMKYEEVV